MLLWSRSTLLAAGRRRPNSLPVSQLTHAASARFYLTTAAHHHHHQYQQTHPQNPPSPLGSPNNAAFKRPRHRDELRTSRIWQRFSQRQLYSETKMATETKWSAATVRQTFLEFFEKRGHTIGMSKKPFGGLAAFAALKGPTPAVCICICSCCSFWVIKLAVLIVPSVLTTRLSQCPPARSSLTMTPPCSSPTRA